MKLLLGVYSINAAAFLINIIAIAVYTKLAGPAGYGSYAIYVVFMAIFLVIDNSLVKAALVQREKNLASSPAETAESDGVRLFYRYYAPLGVMAVPIVLVGDYLFPPDATTGVGGSFVMAIAILEHAFSNPANRLTYHLTVRERFTEVYLLRLVGTVLRHGLAWSTLLFTGSITAAIAAIAFKGIVLGAAAQIVCSRTFPVSRRTSSGVTMPGFGVLLSFSGAALLLLAVQEVPAIFIDRVYGREMLGQYRILYDVVAAIWFIATIYPSILFTQLLRKGRDGDVGQTNGTIGRLGDQLACLHGAYCFGALGVLAVERWVFGFFTSAPFAEGVIVGVCILGFNRFLLEVTQALGQGRWSLVVVGLSGVVATATMPLANAALGIQAIGLAWLSGQVVFFIGLKLVCYRCGLNSMRFLWRDTLYFLVPVAAVVFISPELEQSLAAVTCFAVALVYAVFGLALFLRGLREKVPTAT